MRQRDHGTTGHGLATTGPLTTGPRGGGRRAEDGRRKTGENRPQDDRTTDYETKGKKLKLPDSPDGFESEGRTLWAWLASVRMAGNKTWAGDAPFLGRERGRVWLSLKQHENQLHSKVGPEGLRRLSQHPSRQGRARVCAPQQSPHRRTTGPPPERSRGLRPLAHSDPGTARRVARCRGRDDFINEKGRRVRLNCYNFFVSLNTRRADLGLPQFDLPPAKPVFPDNPVVELAATYIGGEFTLKLRVSARRRSTRWCKAPGRSGRGSGACSISLSWGCCHRRLTVGATSPSFTSPGLACPKPARPSGFDLPAH